MCPSLTFWVQLTILAILRFWYHLNGICLQITFLKINEDIPIFHVYITTLKYMPKASKTEYMSNIRVSHFYQNICGQFYKIILQRNDIFTTHLKNFEMETHYPVFVGQ